MAGVVLKAVNTHPVIPCKVQRQRRFQILRLLRAKPSLSSGRERRGRLAGLASGAAALTGCERGRQQRARPDSWVNEDDLGR